jgi:hypothetical protein
MPILVQLQLEVLLLVQPAAIAIATSTKTILQDCNGGTNGTITLGAVSGGTTPYAWTRTGDLTFTASTL